MSFYRRKTHSFIPPPHRHSSTRFLVWSFFSVGIFFLSLSFLVLCLIYSSRVPWPSLFSLLTWWLQRWPLEKEEIEIRNMPLLPPPPRIARCNSKQGGRIPKLQTYICFKKIKNDSLTRALIFCTSHVFKKVLIKKWVFYSSDTPNPFQKELQCSRMIDFKGPAERKGCLSSSSCSPNRRRGENIKISSLLLFLFFLPPPRYKPDGKDGWERNPVFPPLPLYFYQFQFPLKKSFPLTPVIIAIIIIIVVHWRHTREDMRTRRRRRSRESGRIPFFFTDTQHRQEMEGGFRRIFQHCLGQKNIARTAFLNYFKKCLLFLKLLCYWAGYSQRDWRSRGDNFYPSFSFSLFSGRVIDFLCVREKKDSALHFFPSRMWGKWFSPSSPVPPLFEFELVSPRRRRNRKLKAEFRSGDRNLVGLFRLQIVSQKERLR